MGSYKSDLFGVFCLPSPKMKWVSLAATFSSLLLVAVIVLCIQSSANHHLQDAEARMQRSILALPSSMNSASAARLAAAGHHRDPDDHPDDIFPQVSQNDVFISVKTSKQFHQTRLPLILKTWYQLARQQIWFFTDQPDPDLDDQINGHLKVTECSSSHSRQALCCKMAAEFDAFLESGKKWFCHFDDDNYVNVPSLVKKLQEFDYRKDWYLGKPSIAEPLEIPDRYNMQEKVSFWFGTGGAGFCLSRSLAGKMLPIAGGGKFEQIGDKIRLPDDVTMGYIAEHLLGTPLTVIAQFHSHLEPQRLISTSVDSLSDQISFSYSKYGNEMNVVDLDGYFPQQEDPTKFKSLHCALYPNFSWCPRHRKP